MKRILDWLRQIFNLPRPQEGNRADWYNFDTDRYEFVAPTDFTPYIPRGPARNLYSLYVNDLNESPIDAVIKVLEACTFSAGHSDKMTKD